jgi:hypothetical protein
MKTKRIPSNLVPLVFLIVSVALAAVASQDRYTLKVPNGLAFADFRGYQDWQAVAPSFTDAAHVIRVILANPVMMKAYRSGIPANGKPFPDGSKIAKLEWAPRTITTPPFSAKTPDTVPGTLTEVEFIEKDSARFPQNGGWGYAVFKYDAASDAFAPVGTGPSCGAQCHKLAAQTDHIFTAYPKR